MARVGFFRDRATFQRLPDDADDDYGNAADPWVDLATVFADVREVPGKERLASGRPEDTRMATLRVRSSAIMRGVTGGDRVVLRGVTWDIQSGPAQIGRKRDVLEFRIEAGVAV